MGNQDPKALGSFVTYNASHDKTIQDNQHRAPKDPQNQNMRNIDSIATSRSSSEGDSEPSAGAAPRLQGHGEMYTSPSYSYLRRTPRPH